jgi:hypothetical protein
MTWVEGGGWSIAFHFAGADRFSSTVTCPADHGGTSMLPPHLQEERLS